MKFYKNAEGSVQLLRDVLNHGVEITDPRTKVKTKTLFGGTVLFEENVFPFYGDQPTPPRLAFEEMWFFLRGLTDTSILEQKGCYFWTGNTSREFLDKVGLKTLPEKSIGAAYSKQFRNFSGIDQLVKFNDQLTNQKYSRRMLISLWNPAEEFLMPLTPCWYNVQAIVLPKNGKDYLHFKLTNRSLDTLFGFRYAAMNYRLFQMALCKLHGFELGELECSLSSVHLYENQYERAKELIERQWIQNNNSIKITKELNSLQDLLSLEWSDFDVNYVTNKAEFRTPRPEMVA